VPLASLRPLRHRDFALVWSAALVSNVGSWMQTIAVGVLVTIHTGQARWTGLVAAAAFLPMGLLSPVGGAMADRHDRRRWLLLTTVGETIFAGILTALAATGNAGPVWVTLVVLGGGAMTAIGLPAYQAMLPDLVGPDDLLGAISLSSAQWNLGRVIGPALAGIIIAVGSYTWAFGINAASFGAVMIALLLVRFRPGARPRDQGRLLARIASGARAAAAEPGCRSAIILISVVALLASPFIALVPAMAVKLFHHQASGTAVLVTAQGVGAVIGALALTPVAARVGRRRLLIADLALLPVLLALYGLAPSLALAAVALLAVGASYIGVLAGLNTVVQLRAPEALRGRILSLYMLALGVIYPIGAIIQGAVADRLGLRAVVVGTAVLLLAVLIAFYFRRPYLAESLDDPRRGRTALDAVASRIA
jgi:MFS family permease